MFVRYQPRLISRARSSRLTSLSSKQKRDLVIATVLIFIVAVFIVCHRYLQGVRGSRGSVAKYVLYFKCQRIYYMEVSQNNTIYT